MKSVADADDEAFVQSLWAHEECLDLDSVQYGNGDVVLLDAPFLIPNAQTGIEIRASERLSIRAAALRPGVSLSVGLTPSAGPPVVISEAGWVISGGECAAYGTFGFVAVSRISDNYLVWLAFFLNSNPFSEIYLDHDRVIAITNLGAKYIFPVSEPEKVRVAV